MSSVVAHCVDVVRSGRRPSALGHAAHGVAEIARSVKNIVQTLRAASVPGFLNLPWNQEQAEWDDDAQNWVVGVDLDTSNEAALAVYLRIFREVSCDPDAACECDAVRSYGFRPAALTSR